MQYRARAFEPQTFAATLDAMDAAERQRLIDDFVREEVLYREAQALGLAAGDYVMRQRMVQKMAYLLESRPGDEPTDAQLAAYLAANSELYRVAPSWTFTHVFLDPQLHGGQAGAEQAARQLLPSLSRHAGFNDAIRYGDRFAFGQNYVARTADYIESHFGAAFLAGLASLEVDPGKWHGPIQSEQGWHLVMLGAHAPGRDPELAEIRSRVVDDLQRETAAGLQEQAVGALIEGYDVVIRDAGMAR